MLYNRVLSDTDLLNVSTSCKKHQQCKLLTVLSVCYVSPRDDVEQRDRFVKWVTLDVSLHLDAQKGKFLSTTALTWIFTTLNEVQHMQPTTLLIPANRHIQEIKDYMSLLHNPAAVELHATSLNVNAQIQALCSLQKLKLWGLKKIPECLAVWPADVSLPCTMWKL